ncbi:MAG: hypothetical protein IJ601_05860 [Acidaminococcaceae bacterium]|nr:hypothetical protein [Acidaminococcaceae bacterium]
MNKRKWFTAFLTGILVFAMTTAAFAATIQEKRQETRQKVADTLNKLYDRKPSARTALRNAEGYAVFVSTGLKFGLIGDSHGRGLAHNNKTGQDIFMRMKEYQVGLGLGAKEYALIFAFIDRDAWNKFTSDKWSYGAQVDMAANDGVNGDSFEGAVQAAPGIFVYQMTTKGLAVELSLKGTNYYRDKKLNDPNVKEPLIK